jgi:hypothetical protein
MVGCGDLGRSRWGCLDFLCPRGQSGRMGNPQGAVRGGGWINSGGGGGWVNRRVGVGGGWVNRW